MATTTTAPRDAAEAEQRFYARYGEVIGGTTWQAVQRFLGHLLPRPTTIEEWIAVAAEILDRAKAAPVSAPAPLTLAGAAKALAAPFEQYQVEIKPGALTNDKKRALALAYVDLRAYQDRLDEVIGLEGWSVEYRNLGAKSIICRLTILGHVREDVGEPSGDGDNPATEALAQAFKRTCSAFGLGRYLYSLPRPWADYDQDKRQFVDPAGVVRDIYGKAGLLPKAGSGGRSGGR
jgi:hypothetical protein